MKTYSKCGRSQSPGKDKGNSKGKDTGKGKWVRVPPLRRKRENRGVQREVWGAQCCSVMMQQLVQSPMALAAMIVCMTHICIASKSLQCHLRWAATREYKPWTERAAATVGLHGKHTPTAAADQTPVAGHTQVLPKYAAEAAVDVPPMPTPTAMPTPPIFSSPLASPPAPLGEMAPMPIPPQWNMGIPMQPLCAQALAGMGVPMHPPAEPVTITTPQQGQGIVIPALHPKASSSAGMVELAFGVASGFQAMQTALASLAYNQQLAMYRAQVVPQPTPPPQATPPPRDCIPNCVEYSHQ